MTGRGEPPDRFSAPLYSVAEAARYLGVPDSTMRRWVRGSRDGQAGQLPVIGEPVLTSVPARTPRGPVIPFVGLAEGLVLAAMRHSGVPLQRIRPALTRLSEEFGVTHALAPKRLFTDGAEVLLDYADSTDDPAAAVVQGGRTIPVRRLARRATPGRPIAADPGGLERVPLATTRV
ncbi:MAG: helix-turn-helix domain-containing protein [Kineosporiaceae bacterium]